MKSFRLITMLVTVIALLGLTVVSATAAPPTDPFTALYVDNASHTIAPNATQWYRFDYLGDHSQITLRLIEGLDKGVNFEVYSPEQIVKWWETETQPVGRSSNGKIDSVWTGNTHVAGPYFIKVVNTNAVTSVFTLVVEGKGVTLAPQLTQNEVNESKVAEALEVENEPPAQADDIDGNLHVIAANADTWYRFNYAGTHGQITLKLIGGKDSGLEFAVYTPSQMATWWQKGTNPIGRSNGRGSDLVYSGNSHEAGTYYIKVVNHNGFNTDFKLTLDIGPSK